MHTIDTSFGLDGSDNTGVLITLVNRNGCKASFTNYGARWVGMETPDRNGQFEDVLLGFDTLAGYIQAGEQYHGAIVGRVCGRIATAAFTLNGKSYSLSSNDVYGYPVRNHLHGGKQGFHNSYWEYACLTTESGEEAVCFSLFSPDGEEGYPGNVHVKVTYTLHEDNSVSLQCDGRTDHTTLLNLTNHAFFNLNPVKTSDTLRNHILQLNANHLIECDDQLIPTGNLIPVKNHFAGFMTPRRIADSLKNGDEQVWKNKGYSLAYALDMDAPAITLYDEESGRGLRIFTNQPSVQIYNGYFMDGKDRGKNNIAYESGCGLAIEPQGFPDAIHHPRFPQITISPSIPYYYYTRYCFFIC
ncbi:MAG: galactose mutarotase [Tannerellaceae bacterium]|nr:galactose mutarotase [Tannerellaceae bacterium]